jgi:hypothetical protein
MFVFSPKAKRSLLISSLVAFVSVTVISLFIVVHRVGADTPVSILTGCLRPSNGDVVKIAFGQSPLTPCTGGQQLVRLGPGDITKITVSGGLTQVGPGEMGELSISILDGGVTSEKLADGSVTLSKLDMTSISGSSSAQTWEDPLNVDYAVSGAGPYVPMSPNSTISVTVPAGQTHNYMVVYHGNLLYNFSERTGSSTAFFAGWDARLLANGSQVGIVHRNVISTGFRQDWAALGVTYWTTPYDATWIIQLPEGTYDLKPEVLGYSDGTMDTAHFRYQNLQVLRVF